MAYWAKGARLMGKKLPYTPASRIMSWVRRGWTQSREKNKVLKDANRTCCQCGAKQSRAKGKEVYVEVHHVNKINREKIVEVIRQEILDVPQIVLCKACHKAETEKERAKAHKNIS
jgi:5-methylcytosine-specific restriction endonuclease McrA